MTPPHPLHRQPRPHPDSNHRPQPSARPRLALMALALSLLGLQGCANLPGWGAGAAPVTDTAAAEPAAAARPAVLSAAGTAPAGAPMAPASPGAAPAAVAGNTTQQAQGASRERAVPMLAASVRQAASASAAAVAATQGLPAGEPAALAMDPLEPTRALDLDTPASHTDLWARVRSGFAVPTLDNDLVRKWEQWYAARPDYVQRMTERGGRYLFHIMEELDKRSLPSELALLPFIESAFNPQAMSVAKASGMWQFVPATGRDFDLRQNLFRDDRRSVLASTRAALDYLQTLYGLFGDWQLALAAYNWGQGNVQKAIKRNQAAGQPLDYDSLRMPDETRNYYPKLQAVKNIVLRPQAYALQLPELRNHPYFVSVALTRDIDVEIAARLAQLPIDEFRQLNPQMNKPVILAAVTPQILLPYDNANTFVKALAGNRTLATWTAWTAPRTMKPAEVARQVGMSEERLREVNGIPAKMLVKSGSTLLVPRDPRRSDDVREAVADNAVLALAPDLPPMRRVSFKVGRKPTSVAAVARQYRVSPAQVAQWNHTSPGASFARGQTVVVLVPVAARGTAATVARDGGQGITGGRGKPVAAATARARPERLAQAGGPKARSAVAAHASPKAQQAKRPARERHGRVRVAQT